MIIIQVKELFQENLCVKSKLISFKNFSKFPRTKSKPSINKLLYNNQYYSTKFPRTKPVL